MRKRCIIDADNDDDEVIVGEARNGDDTNWRLLSFIRSGLSLTLFGVEKVFWTSTGICRVSRGILSFSSFCAGSTSVESARLMCYLYFSEISS